MDDAPPRAPGRHEPGHRRVALENATATPTTTGGRRRGQPGHQLASLPTVTVLSRDAVEDAGGRAGRPVTSRAIGATFVVDGTVQRAGTQLRLGLNLLRPDASVAWSEAVEGAGEWRVRHAGSFGRRPGERAERADVGHRPRLTQHATHVERRRARCVLAGTRDARAPRRAWQSATRGGGLQRGAAARRPIPGRVSRVGEAYSGCTTRLATPRGRTSPCSPDAARSWWRRTSPRCDWPWHERWSTADACRGHRRAAARARASAEQRRG